ncbi:MAG: hypothetical protein RIR69_1558 [Actinomycetota bacterium]|jgi:FMN phosphatase YigB (HAD superfamily)
MLYSATELLNKHPHIELVTFDFFDTLITRTVSQPTHVFAEVEHQLVSSFGERWKGFSYKRVRAEQRARAVAAQDDSYRDVTFDEILNVLSTDMDLSVAEIELAAQHEMATEIALVKAVPFGRDVLDEVQRRGMAVMIVSDNYMPARHLVNMAHAAGLTNIEVSHVMVSCEHGGMKHNGRLWREVLEYSGVPAKKILHIGDDRNADVEQPSRLGIATYRDPRMRASHRFPENTHPSVLPLSRLEAWLRDDMYASEWETSRALGAGPIALLVASQIADVCDVIGERDVRGVYFAARDGWLAHQVWDNTLSASISIPAHYLAFSRSIFGRASIAEVNDHVLDRFVGQNEQLTPRQLGNRFGCELDAPDGVDVVLQADQLRELLVVNERVVVEASRALRGRVIGYLRSIGITSPGHHVVVDLGWTGATLADLSDIVREASNGEATVEGRFLGLYWDATPHRTRLAMRGYAVDDLDATENNLRLLGVIRFFETLMTAPHGSVTDFADADGNFTPLFARSDIETAQYSAVIGMVGEAAIESASAIVRGDHPASVTLDELTREVAWATMMQVGQTPRKDEVAFMSRLRHVASVDHQDDGIPLIARAPRSSSTLPYSRTQVLFRDLMNQYWPQGTIRAWEREKKTSVLADNIMRYWPIMKHRWIEVDE